MDNTVHIIEILKKQHMTRSEADMKLVIEYMKEVQFFKER